MNYSSLAFRMGLCRPCQSEKRHSNEMSTVFYYLHLLILKMTLSSTHSLSLIQTMSQSLTTQVFVSPGRMTSNPANIQHALAVASSLQCLLALGLVMALLQLNKVLLRCSARCLYATHTALCCLFNTHSHTRDTDDSHSYVLLVFWMNCGAPVFVRLQCV